MPKYCTITGIVPKEDLEYRQLERLGIGNFPTPLESMPRLSDELGGGRLYVKREDMTGLAMGGNKTRVLDYLLVEAKKKKADAVITTCGIQSNWSRQTVAAANQTWNETVSRSSNRPIQKEAKSLGWQYPPGPHNGRRH